MWGAMMAWEIGETCWNWLYMKISESMILFFGSHSDRCIKSIDIHKTQPKRFLLLAQIKGLKAWSQTRCNYFETRCWIYRCCWRPDSAQLDMFLQSQEGCLSLTQGVPWYNGYLSELVARQRVRSNSNGFNMNKTLDREHEFLPSLLWGAMMAWETGETRWGRLFMEISE